VDNLVLVRAAAAIGSAIRGTVFRGLREEGPQRFRLVFDGEERTVAFVVSLDPVLPWIGRAFARREGPPHATGALSGPTARSLAGLRVRDLRKGGADRVVFLELADGQALVAELATHGANLIHLDRAGVVVASARHPRKAHDRIAPGRRYEPPAIPAGRLCPFGASPEVVEAFLSEAVAGGDDLVDALRRRIFGIGTAAAELVVEECRRTGRQPGEILVSRLARLEAGTCDPVIEGPEDPLAEAAAGRLDAGCIRLLPWEPPEPRPGRSLTRGEDAAATAGLYHEAIEKSRRVAGRAEALRGILRGEIRRMWDAERRIEGDIENLGDPDQHRRFGETLLSGLRDARRVGGEAWVRDPYDPEGKEIAVPAPADAPLAAAAQEHFQKARKARRGIELARTRRDGIRRRLERLERLEVEAEAARGEEAVERIESGLRGEGVPVAIGPRTTTGRSTLPAEKPRVEGVRLLTSSDGRTILIGKTGRDNDRLTFKLSGPEDFWFHAAGVPGAHVVVRNPGREPRPPRATIEEAASVAAWFSDARQAPAAEVHWTRRKLVRRVRGAPPGTVTLKRFETVRVRPAPPAGLEPEGG
jgi:predicted ribosome quality control (RQC) complex YloA/Tae2 family protein